MEFYLLENSTNIIPCEEFDIKNQTLQSTALITDDEIISYNWKIHEITLAQSAYTKLKNYRDKTFPIYPLVLTFNGEKIYGLSYKFAILARGCRSTLISESGEGNIPKNGGENFVIIHGQGFNGNMLSEDPRGNKRIYDYLKSTGRLVE